MGEMGSSLVVPWFVSPLKDALFSPSLMCCFFLCCLWGGGGGCTATLDVMGGCEKDWPWACCGVSAGLRGKEAELLAHRYAGRTPLPQVLPASQVCPAHAQTHTLAHTQMHHSPCDKLIRCTQKHMQINTCAVRRIHRRANVRITHRRTYIDPHLSASVWLCSFFPAVPPPPPGLEESTAPRDGAAVLIDSREFGGRGASKAALPLSSRPPARTTGSLSVANTPQKINTSFAEYARVRSCPYEISN